MQKLKRALADKERGLGKLNVTADDEVMEMIASYDMGMRATLTTRSETAAKLATGGRITRETCKTRRSNGCCSTISRAKSTTM